MKKNTIGNISIAIHGGAGTILRSNMSDTLEREYTNALKEAIDKAHSILVEGGSSVNAVEVAVKSLEDNPLFNAGKGAVFSHNGENEMDACIMEGEFLKAGAVAGVRNIKNPISLARLVMAESPHVFLANEGAIEFAKTKKVAFEPNDYFFVKSRYDQYIIAKENDEIMLDHTSTTAVSKNNNKFGTVGAVALDLDGNLAAATSTGGMTNKRFGRIGDSPIVGAGTYANNNTCAISCTGHGELFIRAVVAHDISCLMEYKNLTLKEACDLVVHSKLIKIGGEGGLIAIDAMGNVEMPFNSEGMYRAMKKNNDVPFIGIYKM
ncbi:MAG: isoaspartyl peptidase/L-asparaginase [Bacteroidia bacterium]